MFVVGDAPSAETVVDLWDEEGDSDPVGGDVREAYTSAESGLLRFGFDVPTEQIPEETGGPVDVSAFRDLTYGYGSLTGEKSFAVTLRAESERAAEDVATVLDAAIGLVQKNLSNGASVERYREVLDRVSVDRTGKTVVVQADDGGESLLAFLGAILGTYVLGLSASSGQQPSGNSSGATRSVPQVAFGFDYDADSQELQITHEGGDAVGVDNLFVRGQGVETGRWDRLGGTASAESDPPQVVAGDRLPLSGVPPDHVVRVVWEPAADTSVTLAMHRGPEA